MLYITYQVRTNKLYQNYIIILMLKNRILWSKIIFSIISSFDWVTPEIVMDILQFDFIYIFLPFFVNNQFIVLYSKFWILQSFWNFQVMLWLRIRVILQWIEIIYWMFFLFQCRYLLFQEIKRIIIIFIPRFFSFLS